MGCQASPTISSSMKQYSQRSPGSNDRTIGWMPGAAWARAWRFFESSQQPTCPQLMHRRRWTHSSPEAKHSSQPSGVRGWTSLIAPRWRHCICRYDDAPTIGCRAGLLRGRAEVFLEPVDDPLDAVDATVWPADRQHYVRFARVADHLDLAPQRAQNRENHLGLHGRTAKVVLGLQQEQRCVVAMDREVR